MALNWNTSPRLHERLLSAVGVYGVFFGAYGFVNQHLPLTHCRDLGTSLDRLVPFVPAFIWPFNLTYPLLLLPALLLHTRRAMARACLAMACLVLFSCAIFTLWPVCVPRPAFVPHTFSEHCVAWVYANDRPVCGFPSLHVSATLLTTLILRRAGSRVAPAFLVSWVVIALSTLFVKQHVLMDVLGGAILALLVDQVLIRRREERACLNNSSETHGNHPVGRA